MPVVPMNPIPEKSEPITLNPMTFPKGVRPWKIKEFKNAHDNFIQPLDEDQSFDLFLEDSTFQVLDQFGQYTKTTENLQWIINNALDKQMNLRAMGRGWSLSKVAVSDDTLINTKRLRHKFTLSSESFHPQVLNNGTATDNFIF